MSEISELVQEGRLAEYIAYHFAMDDIGDIDPSYPMLIYVCDRFELNQEQRFWLAFLFASCYCSPTTYYIYNEFPDYENVDDNRLWRWWKANKDKCVFQTDRLWIRSRDQFVPMFQSYRKHIGTGTQYSAFKQHNGGSPKETYNNAYDYFINVSYFGRFSMFLFLEAVYVVTGFPMYPDGIDWRNAQSSRNGLCFAFEYDDWLRGHEYGNDPLDNEAYEQLNMDYRYLMELMQDIRPEARIDAWNVETSLCAYKKWKRGKRYPGYYLDRQYNEIKKLEEAVTTGVDWSVLWDFRAETYDKAYLIEYGANNKGNTDWLVEERMQAILKEGLL